MSEWTRLDAMMDCILEQSVVTSYAEQIIHLIVQHMVTLYAKWWILDPKTLASFADHVHTTVPKHKACQPLKVLLSIPLASLTKEHACKAMGFVDWQYKCIFNRQLSSRCTNRELWFQNLRENDTIEPLLLRIIDVAETKSTYKGLYDWVRCDREKPCTVKPGPVLQQKLLRYYQHIVSTPSLLSGKRKEKFLTLGVMMNRLFLLQDVDGWFGTLENALGLYMTFNGMKKEPCNDKILSSIYESLVEYLHNHNESNEDKVVQSAWALRLVLALHFQRTLEPIRAFYVHSSSIEFEDKVDQYAAQFDATVPEEFRMRHLKLPDEMKCPITYQRIRDPVLTETGMRYDRPSIERWLKTSVICPLTGIGMNSPALTPDDTFKRKIRTWEDSVESEVRQTKRKLF